MLIVSDEEMELYINNKVKPQATVVDINRGRGVGSIATPQSIRKIIADGKLEGDSVNSILDAVPISSSSVSAYNKGATSTAQYNDPHPDLEHHIQTSKQRISKAAAQRLETALDGITPEKISEAKLRDIASVARDMSQIVKNMEPSDEGTKIQNNMIFYSPKLRDENSFEAIQLED